MLKKDTEKNLFGHIKAYFYQIIIFWITSLVLLLIASAILFRRDDPLSYMALTGKCLLSFSCFLNGFIFSKRTNSQQIFSSLLLGVLLTLTVFLSSLFSSAGISNPLYYLLIPVSTAIGGILGRKRSAKKQKHRKHK